MFEIGWTELMLIGIVALIVIGPKDLPDMFRTMGRFTAKIRGMARDFQRAMDQAAKETGVNDIAADLKAATSAKSMGLDAVKDAASRFEKWDPMKPAAKPVVAAVATVAETSPTIHAPAAHVLAGAQAAKAAVASKAAAKSAAVKPVATAPETAPKTARKPRAVAAAAAPSKPAPKPRAPRKPAKDA